MVGGKKKIYVAIIGLGLVGLLVDRFVLSGSSKPKPAKGAAVNHPSPLTALPKEPAAPALQLEVAPFPANLLSPAFAPTHRDPFSLTDKLRAKFAPPPEEDETESGKRNRPTREDFAASHRLLAVMRLDGEWVAIIDKVMIAQGHIVDECEVIGINDRAARFSCWDGEVDLAIENPLARADSK